MCGRFLLEPRTPRAVQQFFDADLGLAWEPRWNFAATQEAWILKTESGGLRHFARARWGLVPAWSKDAAGAARLINARSETAAEKPSFRSAWKSRRCVIPATGWYEWRVERAGKQPWLLRLADSEFTAFAGLWERWQPAGASALESFTILTAPAVPTLLEYHHRMPAVLRKEWIGDWLNGSGNGTGALPSATDWAALRWEAHSVSTRVNSPRQDDAACAQPLTEGA